MTNHGQLRKRSQGGESERKTAVDPLWMVGDLIAECRVGVKVLAYPICVARCGLDGCPTSDECRRFIVYVMRFFADGSREWTMCQGVHTRARAMQIANERAESAEAFARMRPEEAAAIERWNAEGRP